MSKTKNKNTGIRSVRVRPSRHLPPGRRSSISGDRWRRPPPAGGTRSHGREDLTPGADSSNPVASAPTRAPNRPATCELRRRTLCRRPSEPANPRYPLLRHQTRPTPVQARHQLAIVIVPVSQLHLALYRFLLLASSRMGLLSIIRKIKRKEKEMRILMVGLDNSGKTTIVLKINGEDTSVISPTLGFNIKTIQYQKYSLNIWDVGGQKTIRSYWRNYFEQTDGLVWVVDSSDVRRLDDCRAELHNLLKEERLAGSSLLVFANKQDIQGALKPDEIAKVLNLEVMNKDRHWKIVGCSAYSGEGLLQGFDWLVQDIASRIYVLD
ncbi:ADP-ribosylation factor-like protein 2 [Lolium perenne]|nr:ADP-ribosylation factor-like protein 2 [Lolium perenne]